LAEDRGELDRGEAAALSVRIDGSGAAVGGSASGPCERSVPARADTTAGGEGRERLGSRGASEATS
jgi:hypothetical protein